MRVSKYVIAVFALLAISVLAWAQYYPPQQQYPQQQPYGQQPMPYGQQPMPGYGQQPMPYGQQPGMPVVTTSMNQAFEQGIIVIKGEGAAPADRPLSIAQKRVLAIRAATVVAYRNLSEFVQGVNVSGETHVSDAAVQSDKIRATVEAFIKGAQIVSEQYDPMSELGIVYVKINMFGAAGLTGQLLPQMLPTIPPAAPFTPATPPSPDPHDSLIIDVTDFAFKPALVNRIVTDKGEAVYDPSKVAQEILIKKGCGDYTNDIGKAKAILGERNLKNPLILKAKGVVKTTDVEVTGDDATKIFAANQKNSFLQGANVVFLLK